MIEGIPIYKIIAIARPLGLNPFISLKWISSLFTFKLKNKAILPVLSLVGLVASILLVLRYTNVEITLFGILGLATIVVSNYVLILRTLQNDKTFKENFVDLLNILIPVIIIAIVLCCAPYLQLATLGMTMFWGIIVMFIYNIIITKVLIDK